MIAGVGVSAGVTVVPLATAPAAQAATCDTTWRRPGLSAPWFDPDSWTQGPPTAAMTACLPPAADGSNYIVSVGARSFAKKLTIGEAVTLEVGGVTNAPGHLSIGKGGLLNSGTLEL